MSVQNEEEPTGTDPDWLFFCLQPAVPKNPGDLASNQLAIVLAKVLNLHYPAATRVSSTPTSLLGISQCPRYLLSGQQLLGYFSALTIRRQSHLPFQVIIELYQIFYFFDQLRATKITVIARATKNVRAGISTYPRYVSKISELNSNEIMIRSIFISCFLLSVVGKVNYII